MVYTDKCPVCDSEDWNFNGWVAISGNKIVNSCLCDNCLATWEENWVFTGYSKVKDNRI